MMLEKLAALREGAEEPVIYPDGYAREGAGSTERLRITCAGNHADLVLGLASTLGAPYKVLYVLLVPRGGSAPGRYESPWLDRPQLVDLFRQFGPFWSEDGRHEVWIRSDPDQATVVWDRHGMIYAYGPLSRFEAILAERRIISGAPAEVPDPHVHYYHAEWDDAERSLVSQPAWQMKPLRPEDERRM